MGNMPPPVTSLPPFVNNSNMPNSPKQHNDLTDNLPTLLKQDSTGNNSSLHNGNSSASQNSLNYMAKLLSANNLGQLAAAAGLNNNQALTETIQQQLSLFQNKK